jgi:DnaJ-class molecular chaperone
MKALSPIQQQTADNKARWAHLPGFKVCAKCSGSGIHSRYNAKRVMTHSQCNLCTGTGYRVK